MGMLHFGKGDRRPVADQPGAAASRDPGAIAEERRRLLEQLFREHSARVLDYARYRGATLAEAEDVVSDVFIVLTRRLEEAPLAREEMLPWLLGVAHKVLGNQLRGSRRRQALTERSEEALLWAGRTEEDLSSVATQNVIIRQGLSRLPEKEREALLLVTWDGFQYDEAAAALGCTPGALAQRVLRARKLLLEEIGDIRTYRDVGGKKFSAVERRQK
jgi:RNA polymerase sigma factor (sigma-70 family)